MNKTNRLNSSLATAKNLLNDITDEEFQQQYEALQNKGCGETIESFLERNQLTKEGFPLSFIAQPNDVTSNK